MSRLILSDTEPEIVESSPTRDSDPKTQTQRNVFRCHVTQAQAKLAEPYRSVLVLREVQGLRYRDDGSITGILVVELDDYGLSIVGIEGRLDEILANAIADEPGESSSLFGT